MRSLSMPNSKFGVEVIVEGVLHVSEFEEGWDGIPIWSGHARAEITEVWMVEGLR